jgi:hypothetical protein
MLGSSHAATIRIEVEGDQGEMARKELDRAKKTSCVLKLQ